MRELDRMNKALNVSAKFHVTFQNSRETAHRLIHEHAIANQNKLILFTGLLSNRSSSNEIGQSFTSQPGAYGDLKDSLF